MIAAAVATDLACVGAGQEAQREVAPDVKRRLLSCLLQQSWIPVSSSILLFWQILPRNQDLCWNILCWLPHMDPASFIFRKQFPALAFLFDADSCWHPWCIPNAHQQSRMVLTEIPGVTNLNVIVGTCIICTCCMMHLLNDACSPDIPLPLTMSSCCVCAIRAGHHARHSWTGLGRNRTRLRLSEEMIVCPSWMLMMPHREYCHTMLCLWATQVQGKVEFNNRGPYSLKSPLHRIP